MPDQDEIAFLYPSAGMNGSGCSTRVPSNQYRRATNVTLQDELPSTRPRVRVYKLESAVEGDLAADYFRENNVQGARFFNPAKGQGGLVLGADHAQVAVACGGRKYLLNLDGVGAGTRAMLTPISGDFQTSPLFHLVWWVVAENYAIAGDGSSNTFIWDDSAKAMSISPGYNSVEKEQSRLANGATCGVYAHGRIAQVVNSRQILVGDSIFKSTSTTASDLLATTEQVYWDTGEYFLPPSAMGGILALEILPLRNTQHGHGSIFAHCEDGVFSVDINQAPRSNWPNLQLVKCALLQAGAVGPYALGLRDGDQIYRTRHGVTTLRSATANDDVEGNPQAPLSEPVKTFFTGDLPEWLRFCSVVVWEAARRFLCTVDPCMDGRFRWHRGAVVRNFSPAPAEQSRASWEGLWTLPNQASGIIQFVNGLFFGRERTIAFCRGEDGVNRLVEFTGEYGDDILEDGTRQPIRCQLLTRAVDLARPFQKKQFVSGTLFPRNVRGELTWGVWVRPLGSTSFTLWRSGKIGVAETVGDSMMESAEPYGEAIPLGSFPSECATQLGNSRAYEFLIRWKGVAQIEALRLMIGTGDTDAEQVDLDQFDVSSKTPLFAGYDDFEYSTLSDWTSEL